MLHLQIKYIFAVEELQFEIITKKEMNRKKICDMAQASAFVLEEKNQLTNSEMEVLMVIESLLHYTYKEDMKNLRISNEGSFTITITKDTLKKYDLKSDIFLLGESAIKLLDKQISVKEGEEPPFFYTLFSSAFYDDEKLVIIMSNLGASIFSKTYMKRLKKNYKNEQD